MTIDAFFLLFIIIGSMIKLFSMFVRYAQLPEKEFAKVASREIFRLAVFAEKYEDKSVAVASNESGLSLRFKKQLIAVEAHPANRQLWYTSSLSGVQRYNYIGSKWVNDDEKEMREVLERDLQEMIKS